MAKKNNEFYLKEADNKHSIYFKKDAALSLDPHFHDSIELIFMISGSTNAHLYSECKRLESGMIFFADSYECHYYTEQSKDILAYVLVLSREYTNALRSTYPGFTFETFMLDTKKNERIFKVLESWFSTEHKTLLLNNGYANVLFSEMMDLYPLRKKSAKDDGQELLKECLSYIHNHFTEDITLKDIARNFGRSEEHLSRILKKNLNENFKNYINGLRYVKANELINDSTNNMSITECIFSSGFQSTVTYYRYKKRIGE